MKNVVYGAAALALLSFSAFAQTPTPPPQPSFLSTMTDPMVLSLAAYDLSNVAQGSTAWKFTAGGKTYHISAVQKTGIAAASTIGAAAVAHKWPKLKTPLTVILAGASAYYGGVAYAQAQHHGTAPAPPAPSATAQFRLRK